MNEFAPGALGIISQSGNLALELSLLGARVRHRHLALRLARQPGRHRGGGARRGVRGGRAHPRDRRLLRGLPRRPRLRARRATLRTGAGKQVVLLAAGGSEAGARAAASHTGALASDAAAVEAACRAAGIVRVTTPKQLDRLRARVPCSASTARAPGRDRRRRRRHGRRHRRSRHRGRARAADALARARVAPDGDRADDRHRQPGRPRRGRRAGLLELRAREHGRARVGRGRCRDLHRATSAATAR